MIIGGAYAPFVPILRVQRNMDALTLTWSMSLNSVYQLQTALALAANQWSPLGPKIPAMTTTGNQVDNMTGRTAAFYRVAEIVEGAIDQPFAPEALPLCTNLPAFQCTAGTATCLSLVPFEPVVGPGYENFPVNGETAADQYRSYVRYEVRQAIRYAAAKVACHTAHWQFGNRQLIGLGDMSEANGAIPGTRDGQPSHPVGTHTNGTDIDIAYYQLDTVDNNLRAVCEHRAGGVDQHHCVAPPNTLDVWRTAFFVGLLVEHSRLRVIGVDGQIGPVLVNTVSRLVEAGWLPASAATKVQQKVRYETSDGGQGWYYFHHQYMHISFLN